MTVGPQGPKGDKGDKGIGEAGDIGPPGAPGNLRVAFGLIPTLCSTRNNSFFVSSQVSQEPPAMVRWDLQVLLVSKVFPGCQDLQDILGQRGVMGAVTLETV